MATEETKQQTNNEKPVEAQPVARGGQGFRQIGRPGMGGRPGFGGGGRPGFGRSGFGRTAIRDEFDSKLLDLARVTRVTGGGKRMKFRAVIIAGNKKGKIGIGVDKGKDVSQAIEKATRKAKKSLIDIVIVNGTIPHEVTAKAGPSVIMLKPQLKGRGLVAGGAVRAICELAGIKDVSSKILSGSKNKLNNARGTMAALKKLRAKANKV
jgi:small subunit ribosomal protein S5